MNKNVLLIILSLFVLSCKSPEEKMKDEFISNAEVFLGKLDNTEIQNITITKIDTITEKREQLMIAAILFSKIDEKSPYLAELKNKYDEDERQNKAFAKYDTSGYWYQKSNESFSKYFKLKTELEYLEKKANTFKELGLKNKSKKLLGYDVYFKYRAKDNFGMIDEKQQTLPFYENGELKNLEGIKRNLFIKYKVEDLLEYVN